MKKIATTTLALFMMGFVMAQRSYPDDAFCDQLASDAKALEVSINDYLASLEYPIGAKPRHLNQLCTWILSAMCVDDVAVHCDFCVGLDTPISRISVAAKGKLCYIELLGTTPMTVGKIEIEE